MGYARPRGVKVDRGPGRSQLRKIISEVPSEPGPCRPPPRGLLQLLLATRVYGKWLFLVAAISLIGIEIALEEIRLRIEYVGLGHAELIGNLRVCGVPRGRPGVR